jgi:chemotaxis protein CheD
MYSPLRGVGAICHAMLPDNGKGKDDLRYVDTALRHIYRKVTEYGAGKDLVIKLFGGAQVLTVADTRSSKHTVGEQNVAQAKAVLAALGLAISATDVGGLRGRKLYFCTRNGDVYVRRIGRDSVL